INQLTGWWNGVTTGDFDGDGRLDIAASNWGTNTRYGCLRAPAIRMFYGDFNRDGKFDVVEAYFDPGLKKVVPWAGLAEMSAALPFVGDRFPGCGAYGPAGVTGILGVLFRGAE